MIAATSKGQTPGRAPDRPLRAFIVHIFTKMFGPVPQPSAKQLLVKAGKTSRV
jgi:hypothetical protein